MKNLNIFRVHWEVWLFEGEGSQKINIEGGLRKNGEGGGGLGEFANVKGGGAWQKKGWWCFSGEGGRRGVVNTLMHTLLVYPAYSCLRACSECSVFCLYDFVMYRKWGVFCRDCNQGTHKNRWMSKKLYNFEFIKKIWTKSWTFSKVKDCLYNKIDKRECAGWQEKVLMNF